MVNAVHLQLLQKQAQEQEPPVPAEPAPKPALAALPALADAAAALDEGEGSIDGEPCDDGELEARAREIDPPAYWGGSREEEQDDDWDAYAWEYQGPWRIGRSGWTEEEWDAWAEAWDPEEEKAQALLAEKGGKPETSATRPVATPTRPETLPVPALRRLPSNSDLSVPDSNATTLVMGGHPASPPPSVPPPMPSRDESPTAAIVNSTTHKREYMRLVPYSALPML